MKNLILTLSLALLSSMVVANGLLVIASNNKVKLKSGATVSVGQEIPSGIISVEDGGYIGLMLPDGTPLELKDKGDYEVKGLLAVHSKSESIGSKYLKYVVNDLTGEEEDSYLSNMEITGSVERSIFVQYKINLIAPDKSRLFQKEADLHWTGSSTSYTIQLLDMKEKVLKSWETKDNNFHMDLSKLSIRPGQYVIVQILGDQDASSKKIYLEEPKAYEFIFNNKKLISKLQENAQNSPIGKLQYAKFLEQKGFILDANNTYLELNEEVPGVAVFEKSHKEFKARNNIL